MPELYAIKVANGIKIGYSKSAQTRIKSHMTLGQPVQVIKTVTIPDRTIDEELKKCMKEIKLTVSVDDNSQAKEVYNLTTKQAISILDYIKAFQAITKQAILDIISGEGLVKQTSMKLSEICANYGVKYKRPVYQRDVKPDRVKEIKKFIMDNWSNRNFYLPTILLARTEEDNERYYIIDGQHRCAAIYAIPKNHACMELIVHVVIYPALNTSEQLQLFRDVNKSVPVPKIYLEDAYIQDLHKTICTKLDLIYGNVISRTKKIASKFSHEMHYTAITELLTSKNINKLWRSEVVEGISDKIILELITNFNDNVADEIKAAAESAEYLTEGGSGNDKAVLAYCNKMNGGQDYAMSNLTSALQKIRARGKKPFILGLICKVTLFQAYLIVTDSNPVEDATDEEFYAD